MSRARSLANLANERVFSADSTHSRIGINSTAPTRTLDVVGDGRVSGTLSIGGTINYEDVTSIDSIGVVTAREGVHIVSAGASIYSPANNELALYTNGGERVYIDSNGKVGVGVNPSLYPGKFVVSGDALICDRDIHSRVASGIANSDRGFKQDIDGTERLHLYADNSSNIILEGNGGSEKVRITSAGLVGVGTNNPGAALHVLSSEYPTATIQRDHNVNYPRLRIVNTANDGADLDGLGDGTGGFRISCVAAGVSTERLRITSGGAALFGGLTSQTSDTSKLAVQGGDSNIGIIQVHASGGESAGDLSGITFSHGSSDTTARAKCAIASRATGSYGKGDLCFYVDSADDNDQVSSTDERLRITTGGLFGIGHDSPTVYGRMTVAMPSQTGGAAIQVANSSLGSGDGSTSNIVLRSVNNNGTHWADAEYRASEHIFAIQGTERLRIDSNGNVGIGTADTSGAKIKIQNYNTTDDQSYIVTQTKSGTNAAGYSASGLVISSSAKTSSGNNHTAYIAMGTRSPVLNGNHGVNSFITMTSPDAQGTYGTGQFDFYVRNAGPYSFQNDPQVNPAYWMSSLFTIKSTGNIGINQTNPDNAPLHVLKTSPTTNDIVAKFKGGTGNDTEAHIALVAGYSDTANDNEGHVKIGAKRGGSGNTAHLIFSTYDGTSMAERWRIYNGGDLARTGDSGNSFAFKRYRAQMPTFNSATWTEAYNIGNITDAGLYILAFGRFDQNVTGGSQWSVTYVSDPVYLTGAAGNDGEVHNVDLNWMGHAQNNNGAQCRLRFGSPHAYGGIDFYADGWSYTGTNAYVYAFKIANL